ncbi:MAG: tetratricopeptide repeat protein [Acidobacteriia bacterium]|nr:tetratricopeptide repeat protein [Terriglobia bacterium]
MMRWAAVLFLLLLANTAYIAGLASASIFYMANVLLHVALGVALLPALFWLARRSPAATLLMALSASLGLWLVWAGALQQNRRVLLLHIALALLALIPLARLPHAAWRKALSGVAVCGAIFAIAAQLYTYGDPYSAIRNPGKVPASMQEEGAGPSSPFWPSSANTNVNGIIPSGFFMDSKLCGECHKDIYAQWQSSMHHFASFNNQFYRRSVEQMQELSGTKGSKWCAGCHDHAVFFNGRFDRPIKEQMDTPEAHTGLGCMSCHSIVHVAGSMGNGGITMEYPRLHDLASSRNPMIRSLDRFLTFLDPEPHRRSFLKPFMRDSAEFCSACHKVHLDQPVNNYRWLRGFNDYDNWQASGVSGQGARSFYYPKKPMTCSGCHMPLIASSDPGHVNGTVHSHRFAAANTAVATANQDGKQLKETIDFLQSGFITVDIFAASPVEEMPGQLTMRRRTGDGPRLMSTFAAGEESEQSGEVFLRAVGRISAPLDRAGTHFQPGSSVRMDVVVRTRAIGHFFPGGTVDAFDVWLEVTARDARGRTVLASGTVADNGRGSVDPGAHFYRSFLLDAAGNPINKRNAWQARSVLYVRLIPPGAADVAHYQLQIPTDAAGPIQVEAKLNYRKFSHYYTQYAYAGKPGPGEANLHHDSRSYSFASTNIPGNVSGKIKDRIPEIPIITIASAQTTLALGAASSPPQYNPVVQSADRERWNDYGIGLLLQGDLKGAQYAFERVTEAQPGYADGWINLARALIQEGQTEAARPHLEKALGLDASLSRTHFFLAMVEKAAGNYEEALAHLRRVANQYPRDRVALNQMGRVLFLKRDYRSAVEALRRVLAVDPEDVQAHYNLMLCYRGLGLAEKVAQHETLFRRFKADEASQTITARPRQLSPEDNNERQTIHDHVNAAPLP